MNFTDKKLLIFDLDGTLVDSAPDLANAINGMLKTIGREQFPLETNRSWVGNGAQVLVERALSADNKISSNLDVKLVGDALITFLAIYRDNVCVDSVLYPEVSATLKELQSRHYRLAIVTNKPLEFVAPILQQLGLENIFERVLGGDSLARKKPDPMPLNYLCEQLAVAPAQCLMIGDSKNDIFAAKNANMHSVGLTYGYNYGEDISIVDPDAVINQFGQLLNCLEPVTEVEE